MGLRRDHFSWSLTTLGNQNINSKEGQNLHFLQGNFTITNIAQHVLGSFEFNSN